MAAVIRKWKPRLFLDAHSFEIEFHEEEEPSDNPLDLNVAAWINCEHAPEYHISIIHIYPRLFRNSAVDAEKILVHELLHVHVETLSALSDRLRKGSLVTESEQEAAVESLVDLMAVIVTQLDRNRKTNRR